MIPGAHSSAWTREPTMVDEGQVMALVRPLGQGTSQCWHTVALLVTGWKLTTVEKKAVDLGVAAADREALTAQYATSVNLRSRMSIYEHLVPGPALESSFEDGVLDHVTWRGPETRRRGRGPGAYLPRLSRRAAVVVGLDLTLGVHGEAADNLGTEGGTFRGGWRCGAPARSGTLR